MTDSPIVDDREPEPTPAELRAQAAEARERAELSNEAYALAEEATQALKALAAHDGVSEPRQHQLDLITNMVSAIRHGEQWGYDAHYLQRYAADREAEAERLEREGET